LAALRLPFSAAGEDVGHYGGSYKVSHGLYKKYGDMRLLDTPICENGFMGMGVGAAMTGLRPIVEGMNMGFLLLAFNQISNNCGMLHYTSGGQFKVPMVIRGPGGVGRQLGAEHSQRLESYFQSIPGGCRRCCACLQLPQLLPCRCPAAALIAFRSCDRVQQLLLLQMTRSFLLPCCMLHELQWMAPNTCVAGLCT
jgi:hypothetical protein